MLGQLYMCFICMQEDTLCTTTYLEMGFVILKPVPSKTSSCRHGVPLLLELVGFSSLLISCSNTHMDSIM